MISALGSAAARYAARGVAVFPVEPRGKRPRTRRGFLDASIDPRQVERWWRADGNANVGIATGRRSGLVVLDVDGDPGAESLADLERQHGALPRTASVVTPRGGQHYWFKHPGAEVPCSAGRLGPGLDVRGDGGYVLAPPSVGVNGRRYEPDERSPLAEMPKWLLDLTAEPKVSKPTPAEEWLKIVAGLGAGERNHGLARLTGHLLHKDVDARLVASLVHLVNRRCQPPLPDEEVDRILESIAGRELRKRVGVRR